MRSLVIIIAVAAASCGHLGKKEGPKPKTPTEQAAAFGTTEGGGEAGAPASPAGPHGTSGPAAKGQVAGPGGRAATAEHGPSPSDALRVVGEAVGALRSGRGEPLATAAGGVQALSVLVQAAAGDASKAPEALSRRANELRNGEVAQSRGASLVAGMLTDGLDAATLADPDLSDDPLVRRARRAIAAIDPGEPLARQTQPAASALCATGAALGVAARVPAQGQLPSCGDVQPAPAGSVQAARAQVEQLRTTTARLGQASWDEARTAAASLLDELAAAFDAAGLPRYHADSLRTRAKELRGLDRLSLERSDRIKEALATALAGLDAIGERHPGMASWIASAERAVRAIDPRVPFGLERAVVQDAARAVVDAFAAAVSMDQACR